MAQDLVNKILCCRLALPPVKMFFNKPAWSTTSLRKNKVKFELLSLHKKIFTASTCTSTYMGYIIFFYLQCCSWHIIMTDMEQSCFRNWVQIFKKREVLIQSCSTGAKKFINYVFCHPQFSSVIQNIENRCAILTPVCLCQLLSK